MIGSFIVNGVVLVVVAEQGWLRVAGGILVLLGLFLACGLVGPWRKPRIGLQSGSLHFYLRPGEPIRVPIDVVEGFLMGQGPALLPGKQRRDDQTVTVVVRLAERASEWSHREVEPRLGAWCDSYVTIRGTWCEPIDEQLVGRLNKKLAAAKRDRGTC